jgi:DNA uptake protein ComE-like DNA-binding protein
LEYSDGSTTLNTNATIEKSKESSHILVNINVAGKGELVKLPSIGPMAVERIIG